jgi:cobalt-zinc-cadmium resistance protein CzcA
MLERLATFSIQQRVFVLCCVVVLGLFGLRALDNLPIEAFPDVQDVQVQIVTQLNGAAPEEVERVVTLPIEREMTAVPRQTNLRSVTITGLSVVTVTFSDGTNDYFARQQVLERLQNVSLPPGVQPSLGPLSTAVGEIFRYVLEAPPDMPLTELRAIQDWVIRPSLRIVPGIAEVVSFGGLVKEYQIRIDPYALKRFGVTFDDVADALKKNSSNTGGGVVRRGDEALVIRGIGIFSGIDDIRRVAVATRGGRPILVGDLAEVEIGSRPRSGVVAFNDRDNVVQGIVQMTKGGNAQKIIELLRARVDETNARLPPGVKIVPFYDRTQLISHTVHTVTHNLVLGALLVVGILLVFLRNVIGALIVALVIPLSLLTAFILMDMRGVSANLISLGAVDFGIIIDSAVVLVEALMVKLAARNATGTTATYSWRVHSLRNTIVELGRPILFAKAIIITAFLPIFTFERVEGKIFTPVTYTLTFALLGAILLTFTLVPALLSYAVASDRMREKESRWLHWLQERYRSLIVRSRRRRQSIVMAALAALGVSLGLAPFLGSEFLPKLDEGNVWLTITLPPSSSIEKTKDVERRVRAILREYPEVNNIVTQVGRPDDGTDPKGRNNLEILADLKPRGTWRFGDKEELIADMGRKIREMPGVPTNFSQVIQDNVEESISGVKGEIAVKVFGPDLDILVDKADRIEKILAGIRGATDVAAIKIGEQTEVNIVIDRERIARLGIVLDDVQEVIQAALGGLAVNTFYEGDRRFDVTIRLKSDFRDSVDDIFNIQIPLPKAGDGPVGTVSLGDIARVEVKQGAGRISREQGVRSASVKANLLGRDQGSFVAEAQRRVAEEVSLPPGYRLTWGGQFENQQRALARLQVIVPLSALLIFGLLFWAFKSLRMAVLVLTMVPFTAIGGLAGLGLAGLHLSISAAVGFIAVAGISVQNGVIMVEQMIDLMRNGANTADAVVEGAVSRMRPILMTALMAGLGLLPAAISEGIGSETQRPFAVVIVGGIVSATFFTLILLPLLFPVFVRREMRDEAAAAGGSDGSGAPHGDAI